MDRDYGLFLLKTEVLTLLQKAQAVVAGCASWSLFFDGKADKVFDVLAHAFFACAILAELTFPFRTSLTAFRRLFAKMLTHELYTQLIYQRC